MESCNVFLTFESVDEILRCNISNKNLFGNTIAWCYLSFSIYMMIKFAVFLRNLTFPLLRVKGLTSLKRPLIFFPKAVVMENFLSNV